MMKQLFSCLLLGFLFLAPGCATTPKPDWNSRVGAYNYDDAVKELGVPDRSATLSDGSIVAEWLQSRGPSYGTYSSMPGSHLQSYDVNQFPDRFLRLTFSKDGKLVSWQKFAK